MTGFRGAAFATVLFCFGCARETIPAKGTTGALPEAAYPPACGDYIGLLISLKQAQKDAGQKVDVPQREQLELNYRREAAKRDYDKLAELCAVGINMVMDQMEKANRQP